MDEMTEQERQDFRALIQEHAPDVPPDVPRTFDGWVAYVNDISDRAGVQRPERAMMVEVWERMTGEVVA